MTDKPIPVTAKVIQPYQKGRGYDGKFEQGWQGGPGNPFAVSTNRLRAELHKAVQPEDISRVARELVRKASEDDGPVGVAAAKVLLDYLLGPPGKAQEPQNAPAEGKDIPPPPDYAAVAAALRALMGKK